MSLTACFLVILIDFRPPKHPPPHGNHFQILTFSYYNDQSVNLFRAGSPHKCALAPGLVAVLLRVAPRGVQTSGSQEQ